MSEQTSKILLVEDDENLRLALADNLTDEGYRVRTAALGATAEASLDEESTDLIILDIMLPDIDGYTLCRRLRAAGREMPILMLTARSLEDDLVRGFEAGADDYLVKPYRLRELLVRVAALLRRGSGRPSSSHRFGSFVLDPSARTLQGPEGPIDTLTRTEFDLLAYLLEHRGRALTRQEILDQVWGTEIIVDARTVDNFVSNLKKKLQWSPSSAFRITTLRSIGYRMEVD